MIVLIILADFLDSLFETQDFIENYAAVFISILTKTKSVFLESAQERWLNIYKIFSFEKVETVKVFVVGERLGV